VGPFVDRFERDFAAVVGSPHAVACASGTAAIHLALMVLGVKPGDLVSVNDSTFIASANPVRYCGADVGLIDSETRSWNLDPALLAQALDDCAREGRRVAAVIAVHIIGQPADLGPVLDACARHNVPLIEDAAEALGAAYDLSYPHAACRGRQVGTIGRIGCYSFNGNKIMTTGGGGMLTTADSELARRLKHLSTQAKLPGAAFIHDEVGYNYRLTNLAAALGCAQLERLEAFIAKKRAIAERYRAAAVRLGIQWQPRLAGTLPTDWLASCLIGPRRDAVMAALVAAGVTARPLWHPVSAQAAYRGSRRWGGAVADQLASEGLSLPCSVTLGDDQHERVIGALARALG
jgi:dTDP-4-amino-4,6-dideoxygalactose transaminase